jgi:uncharacterized membrane protein
MTLKYWIALIAAAAIVALIINDLRKHKGLVAMILFGGALILVLIFRTVRSVCAATGPVRLPSLLCWPRLVWEVA